MTGTKKKAQKVPCASKGKTVSDRDQWQANWDILQSCGTYGNGNEPDFQAKRLDISLFSERETGIGVFNPCRINLYPWAFPVTSFTFLRFTR